MLFAAILFAFLPVTMAHSAYMILFPNTIRPGMRFDCHVIRQSKFPRLTMTATVRYGLSGDVASGEFKLDSANDVISLQIPDDISSYISYEFVVTAKNKFGSTTIKETAKLRVNTKRLSLFIQTDKAIYKPEQKVQFRVFAIDADLAVLKETMDIDIMDPSRNRIAQWREVTASSGVFQGEMVMSSKPPLGDWSIEVDYNGTEKMVKKFTVEEFVLPKFEVSLSTPGYGIITDTYLTGSVSAKYTFGKGVEGNGTLIIKKKYLAYKEEEKKYSLAFQIDGSYKFTVDREELFAVLGLTYATSLVVSVDVMETLTGNTLSDSSDVQYYTRRENMYFYNGANNFKPGLKYTSYVFLTDPKKRPLSVENAEISISATMTSETNTNVNGRQVNSSVPVRENGMATYSFKVPRSVSSIKLTAQYAGLTSTKYLYQFRSPTNTYILVTLRTRQPKSGRIAKFLIRSTRSKKNVNYMIISRGQIVKSEQFYMEKRKFVLEVPMTPDMAPSARIVVFYIKRNAEIVADAATFSVQGVFENRVNIRFGRRTSKPGKNIALVVHADPGSQCNVLAIDKSVLLLKKGNDITPDMVQEEIIKYDNIYSCGMSCIEQAFAVPIPGVDVSTLFVGTGLSVITDALLYKYIPPRRSTTSTTWYYDSTMTFFSTGWQTSTTMGMTMPGMTNSAATSTLMLSTSPATPSMDEVDNESMANSAEAKPLEVKPPSVRSLFPDTWIYSNTRTAKYITKVYYISSSRGRCYFNATVPDTITSWVATAFAVHNSTGLGVAPKSANLDVFMKFFIRLELPYSVTRGEQLILQASVFNFYTTDLEVEVRFRNSQCFENILISQAPNGSTVLSFSQEDIIRRMTIPADKGITLNFPIRPVELGMCEIDIQAISSSAGDAVKRDLLVKSEGIEENYNLAILIEVDDQKDFYAEQRITLPHDIVPGSIKIRLAVVGDLMGPSITGLTSLLRMPYGCGEQNMLGFVPNIVVIKYLKAVNNLQEADLTRGRSYMVAGYQRELTYQHRDGSFSAFGDRDPSGTTWLTAYVVKSFAQARPFIYIDPDNMGRSIDWILRQYDNVKGTFKEPGYVIHTDMQGGSASGERNLASYTLIALMEANIAGFVPNGGSAWMSNVIAGAINSLENSVGNMTDLDLFELAIGSYALALAGSDKVADVLAILETTAKYDDGKYWEQKAKDTGTLKWRPPYYQARSRNIEINAYILLTYVTSGDVSSGLQVMRWLVKQRNSFGGYGSTQDTVVGLQALAAVAALAYSEDFDVQINVNDEQNTFNHRFEVNAENALLFQTAYIPGDTSLVQVQATGKGVCLLQISVTYNVMEDPLPPLFSLIPSFSDETINGFGLKVCFNWLGEGVSGMAVMEIGLLSGFTADQFSVTSLGILKKVEEGDNMLVLYFDKITSDFECTKIQMERTGLVAGSQPAVVKLYDYYDTQNHVLSYYQPDILRDSSVCDIGGKDIGCAG